MIRFFAKVIDCLLLCLLCWPLEVLLLGAGYLAWFGFPWREGLPVFENAFDPFSVQILIFVIYTVVAFFYYSLGHFWFGRTVGKLLFRLRVLDAQGLKKITLRQSFLRTAATLLSWLPLGGGFLVVLLDRRKRALHDTLTGTVVVRLSS